MTQTAKILGQLIGGGGSPNQIYTAPSSTQAVISTIMVCNIQTDDQIYLMAIPNGDSPSNQFIIYNLDVPANQAYVLTAGLTLNTGDSIYGYSTNGNCVFTIFGMENS